ncbi:MAG: hypothetical protein DWB56_03945 [Candidatus Jettenia sp.]|uniref:Uncharacterized protein n=1 Tax=Candidatus Jettenia caeni TaxID=247490 RepID=I3ILV9_9BACT|nr:hypothetical protein [Candidatus Jettenia sp. AMX1]MBC6928112.1 hypothetical protein [Candidatus Jettenia sp.]WKZ14464.1 MAG: hypothetical protein QY317_11170 [Candidatus Jettenia caeni]KAA0249476.1 MAG: hypothetical protein EDM77_08780 [Candidatus Jettenia sp. AMX1]MCE7879204.1 hypothetical protein [Candidatus Jettenia sp. AMX1]MCQ3925979.1 hypothetical protein [Candidatus Jettenia sp.]
MGKPFSISLLSQILFHHTPKSVRELKQYLHFGSYHFRDFESYMNHILLVILAYLYATYV